jgi:uncharacterized protein (TIGR04255 family)
LATQRYLSRAPLTEALVDFRVSLPPDFSVEVFSRLGDQLRDRYPHVDDIRSFEAVFEVKSGKPVAAESKDFGLHGYRFRSDDGRDIAQFRRDGFTYNRLAQYTRWEHICPEALRLWDMYAQASGVDRIGRIALRYINRIKVPPQGRLNDFVTVAPPNFPGAPEVVSGFLVRESRHSPESGFMANIVEALEPGVGTGDSALILDIDVYSVGTFGVREEEIRPVLDTLRAMKNEIFFGAITERTATEHE